MKVTKEDLPEREAVLNIELEPEDLEPHLQRAYQRVVQRTTIPGFRKGKAPRVVVERFVGQDALRQEALDSLLPEAVSRAVEEQELEAGGRPTVEVVQDDPPVLKATVPLVPLVELDDYRAIRVEEEPVEVTDEQVQEVLDQLLRDEAPWEPADRPVALGDQLILDVRGVVGDREILSQSGVDYVVAEGNPNPIPGFSEALVGVGAGQEEEFTLTIPEDYENTDLAGSECTFHVVVQEIKEKRIPDLDDEFAKGVGEGYDSVEALREKVRSDLQLQVEQVARRSYEDKVVQELLERTTVSLSPLLVEHEIDHLLMDEEEALRRQQVGMEQYLQNVGKTSEEHREEIQPVALSRLTRSYALRKVAELEGLEVSPEDIEQELDTMAESAGTQASSVRRTFDTPEGRQSLSGVILSRRTFDRLADIAKGREPAPAAALGEEQKTEETSQGGSEDAGTAG